MLLCLSLYIIHLLQSLNVEVFNSLTIVYINLFAECTRFGKFIKIDKLDFLLLYQAAHKKVTDINIQYAWAKAGLVSYNSSIMIDKLPKAQFITPSKQSVSLIFCNCYMEEIL